MQKQIKSKRLAASDTQAHDIADAILSNFDQQAIHTLAPRMVDLLTSIWDQCKDLSEEEANTLVRISGAISDFSRVMVKK